MFLGEMSEWFKVQLSKSCVLHSTVGSNPTLSASSPQAQTACGAFFMLRVKNALWAYLHFASEPARRALAALCGI